MAPNAQGFLAFIATLIRRRLDDETPPRPNVPQQRKVKALPGVGQARHALEEGGTAGFAQWLSSASRVLIADTSVERLQSPMLSSPIRTAELCDYVDSVVRLAPEMNILEVSSCEAVGDALTEARECPFRRIEEIRRTAPGLLLRATLSAASCLGDQATPRSALPMGADQLVDAGIDIIRVVDPYNDPVRLTSAITAATLGDAVVEGAICINGPLHPSSAQPHIERAVSTAKLLEQNGVHSIVLEDRCGIMRPVGAYTIVRAVRREVRLPIWMKVIESNGYGLATLIAAVEAGAVGVDVVLPCLSGAGIEPGSLALATALADTERRPEIDPLAISTLDEQLDRQCKLLGGWHPARRVVPDAADLGISPWIVETVLSHCGGQSNVSRDHVLSACSAALEALGRPALAPPAPKAVITLATQIIKAGAPAGPLIDQARADDPDGILDAMKNLREGGFPETTIEAPAPKTRNELLRISWREAADRFIEHQARFGHLELLPSEALRFGLGVGDELSSLVNGDPQTVQVLSIDLEQQTAEVELNGKRLELRLSPTPIEKPVPQD